MNAIRDGIVNTGRRTLLATGAVVLLAALTVPSAGAQSVEAIKKAGVLKVYKSRRCHGDLRTQAAS